MMSSANSTIWRYRPSLSRSASAWRSLSSRRAASSRARASALRRRERPHPAAPREPTATRRSSSPASVTDRAPSAPNSTLRPGEGQGGSVSGARSASRTGPAGGVPRGAGRDGGARGRGLPAAFSQVLVGTIRQPTSRPPPAYEEIALRSDGLRLRAWLVGGRRDRAAVVVAHGLGDSLESYEGLAATLQRRGHTVLLLDLRGHGGSEGRTTTLGGREREDVRAGLRPLRL